MFHKYKIPILAGIGGLLELYDFIIFALFYPQIQLAFFAQISNPTLQLLVFFIAFSSAYVVRPIGGVIAGYFGDRYGRKLTFTVTIMVMAVCVLLMGLLPTYAQIGWFAPIALLLLRVTQGLAVGGELAGAIVYVFESFKYQIGLALGILYAMITLGNVLGNIVHVSLSAIFPVEFAWRVAFMLGSLVAIIGYLVRRKLHETPAFMKISNTPKLSFFTLFKQNRIILIAITACIIPIAFNGIIVMLYLSKYLKDTTHYLHTDTLMLSLALLNSFIILIVGFISDYINYKNAFKIGCLLALLSGWLYVYILNYSIVLGVIVLMLPFSVLCGLYLRIICEAFPTHFRYSGVALSYNIGFAVVGAFVPLLIQSLLTLKFDTYTIAFASTICAIIGLIGISTQHNNNHIKAFPTHS